MKHDLSAVRDWLICFCSGRSCFEPVTWPDREGEPRQLADSLHCFVCFQPFSCIQLVLELSEEEVIEAFWDGLLVDVHASPGGPWALRWTSSSCAPSLPTAGGLGC